MKKKITISVLSLLTALYAFSNAPLEDGKLIFTSRCASCHNVNKVVLGPALAGVDQRRSVDWIVSFVHSSQTVIKGGDKDAIALYEKFNKIPMPDHPDLSEANIKNVLAYIKSATQSTTEPIPFRPEKLHPSFTPIAINNFGFFGSYLVLVVLMAAALLALVKTKEIQRNIKVKN
jgi:mono/diheme cytochrome c family protein